jgi:predicted small integral membrane protein
MLALDLQWMEWTRPTAIFFLAIFCMLVAMTIWQLRWPSPERRGFLPIPTTPGDRLFIGLLGSAYLFLAWIGLTNFSLWIMLAVAVGWMAVVMRWG